MNYSSTLGWSVILEVSNEPNLLGPMPSGHARHQRVLCSDQWAISKHEELKLHSACLSKLLCAEFLQFSCCVKMKLAQGRQV